MTGISTLSIECMSGRNLKERFLRIIETSNDIALADLHFIVLELAGFDGSDHLSDFYLANSWHGRKTWITVSDDGDEVEEDRLWEKPLVDLFPLPRNRNLYYLFDYGDSWIFEIRKKGREKRPVPGTDYPILVYKQVPQPVQYAYPDEDLL